METIFHKRFVIAFSLVAAAALMRVDAPAPGPALASAPAEPSAVMPEPAPVPYPDKKPSVTCAVRGRLFCSEYGTRYKEPVMLVFVDGEKRYPVPFGEIDGGFEAHLPCAESYTMRIEFQGRGFEIGRLEVPPKTGGGFRKFIEIYHPGSILELIWEIRDGGTGAGMDVRLRDLPEKR